MSSAPTKAAYYRDHGHALFQHDELPFTDRQWSDIKRLVMADGARFQTVTTGDTSEPADVMVHRILHDGNPPTPTDPELADALLQIIASPERIALYEGILGVTGLMIRRAQAHILGAGGFIGRHRDSESSPHYLAAVVLQLQQAEEGGDFAVYMDDGEAIVLDRFAMLLTAAELLHEVLPVRTGSRCSLAFWLASKASL